MLNIVAHRNYALFYIFFIVYSCFALGCSTAAHETLNSHFLSIRVNANASKPDGTPWDSGGGEVFPMIGPFMLPSFWSRSPYPDLALTQIDDDGTVIDYTKPANRYGVLESECPDRLTCRWDIQVPDGAYALVASDLDFTINKHLSFSGVAAALKGASDGNDSAGKPFITTREFVAAYIFIHTNSDAKRAGALQERVRQWLTASQMSFIPEVSFPVGPINACQTVVCQADDDGNSGSISVTIIPSGSPTQVEPGNSRKQSIQPTSN